LPDTAPDRTGGSQSPGIAVLAGRFALFGAVLPVGARVRPVGLAALAVVHIIGRRRRDVAR